MGYYIIMIFDESELCMFFVFFPSSAVVYLLHNYFEGENLQFETLFLISI